MATAPVFSVMKHGGRVQRGVREAVIALLKAWERR
jgi:hypothetical protein